METTERVMKRAVSMIEEAKMDDSHWKGMREEWEELVIEIVKDLMDESYDVWTKKSISKACESQLDSYSYSYEWSQGVFNGYGLNDGLKLVLALKDRGVVCDTLEKLVRRMMMPYLEVLDFKELGRAWMVPGELVPLNSYVLDWVKKMMKKSPTRSRDYKKDDGRETYGRETYGLCMDYWGTKYYKVLDGEVEGHLSLVYSVYEDEVVWGVWATLANKNEDEDIDYDENLLAEMEGASPSWEEITRACSLLWEKIEKVIKKE